MSCFFFSSNFWSHSKFRHDKPLQLSLNVFKPISIEWNTMNFPILTFRAEHFPINYQVIFWVVYVTECIELSLSFCRWPISKSIWIQKGPERCSEKEREKEREGEESERFYSLTKMIITRKPTESIYSWSSLTDGKHAI